MDFYYLMKSCVAKGHSTAAMAGRFADSVNADLLVLNHLGSRAPPREYALQAQRAIKGVTRVVAAQDFMHIKIPREGYAWSLPKEPQTTSDADLSDDSISQVGL